MPYKSTSKAKEESKRRMQRYRNKGVTRPVTPDHVTPDHVTPVTPINVTPCVTPDTANVTPKNKPVKPCKNCIILQGQINKLKAIISAGKKKIEPVGDKSALCRHRLTYCRICN